jgi:hypothetical protein
MHSSKTFRAHDSPGRVSKEEFPIPDVTRQHGVGGVAGLLPDLEWLDACLTDAGYNIARTLGPEKRSD